MTDFEPLVGRRTLNQTDEQSLAINVKFVLLVGENCETHPDTIWSIDDYKFNISTFFGLHQL